LTPQTGTSDMEYLRSHEGSIAIDSSVSPIQSIIDNSIDFDSFQRVSIDTLNEGVQSDVD